MARRILFIYRGKKGTCSAMTIYRRLHGFTEIRSMRDEFGRGIHKPYRYSGIPHRDIIPGAFFVAARDEKKVTEFFEKYKVPYIRIRPKRVENSNWPVSTDNEKPA